MRSKEFDKDDVVRLAMDEFWVKGFNATSIQDVVCATGVNRASLYDTFGDKEALFAQALEYYEREILGAVLAQARGKSSGMESVEYVFEYFFGAAEDSRGTAGCLVVNTAIELAATNAAVGQVVQRVQSQLTDHFAVGLRRGKTDGSIWPGINPEERSVGLMATLMGLLVLVRSGQSAAQLRVLLVDTYWAISAPRESAAGA